MVLSIIFWLSILAAIAVATVLRPYVGILALSVAIPLRTVLPRIGPLDFPWVVGAIAVLGLLIKLLRDGEYRYTRLDIPILLLGVAHAVSMFFTPLDPFAIQNYLSIAAAYGTYFLATNLIDTERQFQLVVSGLLLVGALHALVTMYFLAFGEMPFFVPVERLNRVANAGPAGRFWGTMGSTSSFALFFVFLIPLAVGRALNTTKNWRAAAYVAAIIAFAVAIGMTQARSGLLGLFVVFTVFAGGFVSMGIIRPATLVSGSVAAMVPAGAVLYVSGYLGGIWRRLTLEQSFWGGRLDRFYHAIEVGLTHPLGAGKGDALVAALARAGATNPKKVHNVVLGLFAQTGILGLFAILWIIVAQARTNLSLLVSEMLPQRQRIVLLSTFAGLAGYWVMAMFMFKHDWGFVFLYFGLNMAYVGTLRVGEDR